MSDLQIPSKVVLQKGKGDLPFVALYHNGAEAQVYLQGANVFHYQPAGQKPVLWHSELSHFKSDKAIRGGIPICWPWFGPHPDGDKPSHGVARTTKWIFTHSEADESSTRIELALPANTFKAASLKLRVELSETLKVTLITQNLSDHVFEFTEALHSYFSIGDIQNIEIAGLENESYIDQLNPGIDNVQKGAITFSQETDRIYLDDNKTATIIDKDLNRKITIGKENSFSTVVWNPWIEKSKRMADLGDEEYHQMVCVETANCGPKSVKLDPKEEHSLGLVIKAEAL